MILPKGFGGQPAEILRFYLLKPLLLPAREEGNLPPLTLERRLGEAVQAAIQLVRPRTVLQIQTLLPPLRSHLPASFPHKVT